MMRMPSFLIVATAGISYFTHARGAEYFWSSQDACSTRILQIERIREGLKAGLIELRLGKLGHSAVEAEPQWKGPDEIEKATFEGLDKFIRDIQLICKMRYPEIKTEPAARR